MATIVTRAGKGSPLTNTEVDSNFTNLNAEVTPLRHSIRPSLLLDFANSKTLDPRITFSRSSTGTYYDGKTFAKAEENLLSYSQEFDNAYWTKNNVSVTANATTAPDGTTTADKLIGNGTNPYVLKQDVSSTSGNYQFSVYAKKAELDWVRLTFNGANYSAAWFDLNNGVKGTETGTYLSSASIEDVGNGWYRCSIYVTGLPSGLIDPVIGFTNADNTTTGYTGNGTDGIYLWGAQVEQRSAVTAYTPTTSQPITNYIPVLQTAASGTARFDHDPVTGESKGLLIEEQRTNLFPYSQVPFGSNVQSSPKPISNAGIAPDGTQTAMMYEYGTTGSEQRNINISVDTSSYALSIYVKALSSDAKASFNLGIFSVQFLYNATFDFATESFSNDGGRGTFERVGNGWYRLTFAPFVHNGVDQGYNVFVFTALNNAYTQGKVLWWGIQLEKASFPTSYIPTSGSQVTRSADSASMTGDNFSSWYRQDEGTLYAEGQTEADYDGYFLNVYSSTTDANRLALTYRSSIQFYIYNNGAAQASLDAGTPNFSNGGDKIAASYSVNNFNLSLNGSAVATDTSGIIDGNVDMLRIGHANSVNGFGLNGTIKKISYYPIKLTDAELQALTEA